MRILNLYCGIGGNRELWGDDYDITAVEIDKKIADKYSQKFPNDNVIIDDAHEYLLDNYKQFDFIWSSPPCQTHSRTNYFTQYIRKRPVYVDLNLYQEIIFLDNFYKGKYVVENVMPFYKPLMNYICIGRHYFWSNFNITKIAQPKDDIGSMEPKYGNKACKKKLEERNAVNSELGKHILDIAIKIIKQENKVQTKLF